MPKKRTNPLTFSQFAFRVIKSGFTVSHDGNDILVIGGSNRSVLISADGKGSYSWRYNRSSTSASQDWDRAFNRLKMTKDEWGWRELQRAAGAEPMVIAAPPGTFFYERTEARRIAPGDTPESINQRWTCKGEDK